jgi:hypothetical protein
VFAATEYLKLPQPWRSVACCNVIHGTFVVADHVALKGTVWTKMLEDPPPAGKEVKPADN